MVSEDLKQPVERQRSEARSGLTRDLPRNEQGVDDGNARTASQSSSQLLRPFLPGVEDGDDLKAVAS
jgi:hypothetical protein